MTFDAFAPPPRFPAVRWKNETATFVASGEPTSDDPDVSAPAALVFAFYGDKIVLADIVTRGWCIPSGHVEPGETFEEAVRREAREEAGVTLGRVACLGYFVLTDVASGRVRHAPTYVGEVLGLENDPPLSPDSRGRQLVNVEDVAGLYFSWDDLLAQVFAHAYQEKQRRFRAGIPVSALLTGE